MPVASWRACSGVKKKIREHDAKNLIRLLTRLLFVWFIKEKGFITTRMPAPPFFDAEWMYGITGGFDVVIGNPPYVQVQKFPRAKKEE